MEFSGRGFQFHSSQPSIANFIEYFSGEYHIYICLTTPTHSLSMVLLYDLWCLALGHTVLGFWTGLDKDYDFGHGYGFACI